MSLLTTVSGMLIGVSNVYTGNMPDSPNNAVCIYPTGGYPRSLSGTQLEEPTFMIKVRNTSYAAGEAVCDTVKDLLHGKSSGGILMIEQQSDINNIGRDEKNRQEWTLNFRSYFRR